MAIYDHLEKIKTGGQAEIWRVTERDGDPADVLIMKRLLPAPQLEDPEAELKRFHREVRSQQALGHANIMPIIGWDFDSVPPWYVMPMANGSLDDLLAKYSGDLDEEKAIDILGVVAEAVGYAHGEGILHRDLKPANVLDLEGEWVVADFGLCRDLSSDSSTITQTSAVVGTVAYLAPEQFDDAHAVKETADVFSLGRILYRCLTGRVPFPFCRIDSVPPKFQYLLTKCLAEDPAERYQTVAEFHRELMQLGKPSASFALPAEQAKGLAAALLEGDSDKAGPLLRLLLESADDEAFYKEFAIRLSKPVLERLQDESPEGFATVVRRADEYSDGSHPFSYTDVIADFMAAVFAVAHDPALRRLALQRILLVGAYHNRFYFQEVFTRVVNKLTDAQDRLMVANLIDENAWEARFYKEPLKALSLPQVIKEVVDKL